jgi:hypothetical protein
MRQSISALDNWLAMHSNVCVSQAVGATLFILQVWRSATMVAHVQAPPDPAMRLFLRVRANHPSILPMSGIF